jgi:hypothetical protein
MHLDVSAADIVVFSLLGMAGILTWVLHERAARQRERDRKTDSITKEKLDRERHETIVKEMRDQRALTLGAIQQRVGLTDDVKNLKDDVLDLEVKAKDLDSRMNHIEHHLGIDPVRAT